LSDFPPIYLYIIVFLQSCLLLNVFFQAQIISKLMAAGASPQTQLGELAALPQTARPLAALKGSYF